MAEKPKLFVSYSHSDIDETRLKVIAELLRHEFHVWMDVDRIPLGASWEKSIVEAIRNSDAMLLVYSPSVAHSTWIKNEVELAKRFEKPIVGIRIWDDENGIQIGRQVGLPPFEGIKVVETNAEEIASALDDLLETDASKRKLLNLSIH